MLPLTTGLSGVLVVALLAQTPAPAAAITGTISDPTGRAIPGAIVSVAGATGDQPITAVTDYDGTYRIDIVAAGAYLVEVKMPGFLTRLGAVHLQAGEVASWSGAMLAGVAPPDRSIERHVLSMTGADAVDCGRLPGRVEELALTQALECASRIARAGRPFSLVVQHPSRAFEGLVGSPDGVIRWFRYDEATGAMELQLCARPRPLPSDHGPQTTRITCAPAGRSREA